MKVAWRSAGWLICLLLVSVVAGCGGGGDFVQVSGMVTLDGNPLEAAAVTFFNPETEEAVTGLTNAEGRYNLRAQPGDYKVAVSKYEGEREDVELSQDDEAENLMAEFEQDAREDSAQGKELIPERFSDMAVTELKFTVPSGGTEEANFMNLTSR